MARCNTQQRQTANKRRPREPYHPLPPSSTTTVLPASPLPVCFFTKIFVYAVSHVHRNHFEAQNTELTTLPLKRWKGNAHPYHRTQDRRDALHTDTPRHTDTAERFPDSSTLFYIQKYVCRRSRTTTRTCGRGELSTEDAQIAEATRNNIKRRRSAPQPAVVRRARPV